MLIFKRDGIKNMKIYFETCFKNFLCFVTFECFDECDQYTKTPSSPFCILKVFWLNEFADSVDKRPDCGHYRKYNIPSVVSQISFDARTKLPTCKVK